MKKLKVAIATLLIIPLIIAASSIYLNRVTENMSAMINAAEQSERASDSQKVNLELASFNKSWNIHKHVIATFIRHSEIDIADQSAARLNVLAESSDRTEFYAECEALKMQLKNIADTEKFSIDNIL
jgi:uncharacterized membrane protein YvbJ